MSYLCALVPSRTSKLVLLKSIFNFINKGELKWKVGFFKAPGTLPQIPTAQANNMRMRNPFLFPCYSILKSFVTCEVYQTGRI